MKESIGKVPSLAVILVGQRRDSLTYVRNKILACEEVGFRFSLDHLPENCTEEEICDKLSSFNDDPSIHGILVQLPLPQVIHFLCKYFGHYHTKFPFSTLYIVDQGLVCWFLE